MPDETISDETAPIRTSFLVASLLSLAWLALSAWAFLDGGSLLSTPTQLLPAIATMFAPVAACYALAAALPANGRRVATRQPEDPATAGADGLAEAEQRIESLRTALASEVQGLQAVNETLGLQAQSVGALVAQLGKAGVEAMAAGQQLDSLLPKALAATATLQQALAIAADGSGTLAAKAVESGAALASELDRLAKAAEEATARLAEARAASESGTRAIRGEADALFQTLENTHVARRDALSRQGEAMAQQLQNSYARLEALAAAAGDRLAGQLGSIDGQAASIEGRLQGNAALTEALLKSGERTFQLLDARLAHSSETSEAALDRLSTRVQEAGQHLAGLTSPIRDNQAAAGELGEAVGQLRETTLQVVDLLGKAIPEQAHQAGLATAGLAEEVGRLTGEVRTTVGAMASLAEPLQQQRQLLDEAGALAASQRQESETAAAALVAEVQQARLLLGEVEQQIETASLASASGLVDTMSRLREVIGQTSGSMREALAGAVAEAKESLSSSATAILRHSFVEPVAQQAQQAEEIAAKAAERTAQSMAALADVLRLIEGQVAERTVSLESAQQADLMAAAGLLTEQLAKASVSIASALGRPMDDDDWAAWRKGERTLFHRRARALLDRQEAKELRQLLQGDSDLAQAARDYSAGFEALLRRIDPQVPGLATALQGSEQGRLAAALAEGLAG